MGKEIQTTYITDDSGLPILKRTLDWIQESYNESIFQITKASFGYDDSNQGEVWQLSYMDIKNTSGTTWTWNAGSVVFGSKIYKTTGGTTTLGVGETLKWYFIETPQLGEPTLYEDLTSHNTNVEVKIGICKSTENISKQIQDVNIKRYMALNKYVTFNDGNTQVRLKCVANQWTISMTGGGVVGDNYLVFDNYKGGLFGYKVPTKASAIDTLEGLSDFIYVGSTVLGQLRITLPPDWIGSGSDSKGGVEFNMSFTWLS